MSSRQIIPRKWANAHANTKLLTISTWSGYARRVGDPFGPHYEFDLSVDGETLGAAVLDCLAHSRFLDTPELRSALFHPDALTKNYEAWVERLMLFGNFKTKRAMFKDMTSCHIEQEDDTITIVPTHHEKLEGWSAAGITEARHVTVSAQESPPAIATALREAFLRCT